VHSQREGLPSEGDTQQIVRHGCTSASAPSAPLFPGRRSTPTLGIMGKCVVRYSLLLNGVLGFIGTAFSLLIVLMSLSTRTFDWPDLGGLALFGSTAVLFGGRTLNREPLLVVDDKGITAGRGGVGFVPWEEVQKVSVVRMGRVDAIWVYPLNPEKWRPKLSRLSCFYWRVFPKWRVFNINLQNMDMSTAEIVLVLKDLAAQGKVELADA